MRTIESDFPYQDNGDNNNNKIAKAYPDNNPKGCVVIFQICQSCLWCATSLDQTRIFNSCPNCLTDTVNSIPLTSIATTYQNHSSVMLLQQLRQIHTLEIQWASLLNTRMGYCRNAIRQNLSYRKSVEIRITSMLHDIIPNVNSDKVIKASGKHPWRLSHQCCDDKCLA